jgi:histidyl-tRNA synthetase
MIPGVKFQTIKGTHDRLPDDAPAWRFVLETARTVLERSSAGEIHTPTFEDTGVFSKGVGASSDIVRKEMYTFSDKGERDLTLRPEATAPIIRAYLEHGMSSRPAPVKLWTCEPMFRAEKPARGRQRQFHQLGLEIIGLADPITDAETIDTGKRIFDALGVRDYVIRLGSVGDPEDRQEYNTYLRGKLSPMLDRLSDDSKERLELNPMRILDSKDRNDQALLRELEIKPMLEFLGANAREHFDGVQAFLRAWGVPFVVDSSIVRGLDYYRRTAYEFIHNSSLLGAQSTILAGGRYDGLAEMLGGPHTPGVGWGSGVERILLALEAEGVPVPAAERPLATVIPLDQDSFVLASTLARELQVLGRVMGSYRVKGLGKALGDAEKSGSRFAVLIGSVERDRGVVSVKTLETREQVEVPRTDLEAWFRERI